MLEIHLGHQGKTRHQLLAKTWCWHVGTRMYLSKWILNLIHSASSKFIALKPCLMQLSEISLRKTPYIEVGTQKHWVGKREMQFVSPNVMLCSSHDLCLSFGWWPLADKPWSGKLWSHTGRENIDEHLIWCMRKPLSLMLWRCDRWHVAGVWCRWIKAKCDRQAH